jgi:hypothetical protein
MKKLTAFAGILLVTGFATTVRASPPPSTFEEAIADRERRDANVAVGFVRAFLDMDVLKRTLKPWETSSNPNLDGMAVVGSLYLVYAHQDEILQMMPDAQDTIDELNALWDDPIKGLIDQFLAGITKTAGIGTDRG